MANVEAIMARDLLTVDPSAPTADVVRQMDARQVGAVLVHSGEELVGIFTERDVMHAAAAGRLEGSTVGELMTRHPETIEPSDSTGHAAAMMIHGGFRHLPVSDGGKVVGVVSIRDLMRHVLHDESPRGA
jgi:CBS domain-containing protein